MKMCGKGGKSGFGKDVPEGRDGVAEREERVGSGLRCGEANPNQWDGVEPSHWGDLRVKTPEPIVSVNPGSPGSQKPKGRNSKPEEIRAS